MRAFVVTPAQGVTGPAPAWVPMTGTVEATTLVWLRLPMKLVGDALALVANAPLAASKPAPAIRVAEMTAADRLTGFLGNLLKCMGINAPSASDFSIRSYVRWTAGDWP